MKNLAPVIALCFFLAFVLAVSCGPNPQKEGPKQTAEAFLKALQYGDFDAAKEYCSEGSAKNLGMYETFGSIGANPFAGEYEILREEVDGDYANVYYDVDGREKFVKLRKDGGEWVVLASKADMGNMAGSSDSASDDLMPDLDLESILEGSDEEDEDHANKYIAQRSGLSAEETGKSFLDALASGNIEEAYPYSSKSTQEMLETKAEMQTNEDDPMIGAWERMDFDEKGSTAKLYYTEEGKKGSRHLDMEKDINGNWEVIMTKSDFSAD